MANSFGRLGSVQQESCEATIIPDSPTQYERAERGLVVRYREDISEKALKQMWTSQPATQGTGYGLGFNILAKRPDGSAKRIRLTGASGTLAMLDFDEDLIVIVFTQVEQSKITAWRNRLLQVITRICTLATFR